VKLRITQPGQEPFEVEVPEDHATIGRGADCDVVVHDPFVSKAHLRLYRGLVVLDLGSSNGTFLEGGKRVEGASLVPNGRVTLGPESLLVEVLDATPAAPAGETREMRELRAVNASLAHEVEQTRQENDYLRTQVETMRKAEATRAAVEELSKAHLKRQGKDLDDFERLTAAYTQVLKKLQADIDSRLTRGPAPY